MYPMKYATRALQTVFLDKQPCCLELHPVHQDYLVVGSYELAEDGSSTDAPQSHQQRNGGLSLYRFTGQRLNEVHQLALSFGILDVHWQVQKDLVRLGAATSTGSIILCNCIGSEDHLQLVLTHTLQVRETDVVITAFAWGPVNVQKVFFTTSAGEVMTTSTVSGATSDKVVPKTIDQKRDVQLLFNHDFSAWTVACHRNDAGCRGILSGGDDGVLQWTPLELPATASRHWACRRTHHAGVTAILPLWDGYVATGSYDDNLRVVKPRHAGAGVRPEVLAELNLGGGVWRLIRTYNGEHNSSSQSPSKCRILVCCMYAGACVVDVMVSPSGQWQIDVVARFTEHQSMCYGGILLHACNSKLDDFDIGEEDVEVSARNSCGESFVTCSFYDKRLCLWSL